MKNNIFILTFSVFLLFGCSPVAPEDVNQNHDDDLVENVEVTEDAEVAEEAETVIFEEDNGNDITNWNTYTNDELGYEIKYPTDWRIASSIMDWYETENWVMITNLSVEEEKEYLKALDDYVGIGSGISHIENADGRAVIIQPTTNTIEELKENDVTGWDFSDFRETETSTGLEVTQFREIVTWEMDRDFEVAFIPYSGDKMLRGDKITYISLEMERNDGDYENEIFSQIISTFKFNQNNNIADPTIDMEDSVVEGNIYKNNLYGFQFVIPEGADLITDKRAEGVEDYDPLYGISLYLGDSINTHISVYHKDARIKDVESSYTEYHKVESDRDRGVEVWENGPVQGPANWWFLNTFFFGDEYAIKIQTSNDEQSEDFFEKHAELVDSFEFSEEF